MKYTFLLPLVLLLGACGGNAEKENTGERSANYTQTGGANTDSVKVLPAFRVDINPQALDQKTAEQKKLLLYFFGKKNALSLLSVMEAMEKVETDRDLHTCLHYVDSLCRTSTKFMQDEKIGLVGFYDHIDSINNLYKSIGGLLPCIEFGCQAECSEPVVTINYMDFEKRAQKTTGDQDDEYFAFMRETFGEGDASSTMSAVWFSMTWDYGGNSLLGAGHHYKALKHAQDIKTNSVFINEIELVETICIEDATQWNTLFYTAEKAIAEIKKIMTLDIGIKNKKLLEERIKGLQSPDEHMQLDCEHHDCQYG